MSEVIRRRRRTAQEKANHERWMISYADMLTLLLAFFILLWSAATVNKSKLMEAAAGMLQAFEGTPPMLVAVPSAPHGIEHSAPTPGTSACPDYSTACATCQAGEAYPIACRTATSSTNA